MSGITHIAGLRIETGPLVRQRCAWCGAVLVDADLTMIAFEVDDPSKTIGTWPPGAQVHVDGPASSIHAGDQLPDDSCAALDPAVTH
jgi:hypothetical protein